MAAVVQQLKELTLQLLPMTQVLYIKHVCNAASPACAFAMVSD